jgi:RNA polymerase sigma factor (sigma-70 family)
VSFDAVVLPHLDAGYTLARHLMGDAADAEDVVQESVLRALRYFHTLRDPSGARAWFLAIVRRECWSERGQGTIRFPTVPYDDAQRTMLVARVSTAIAALPERLRETLVLREAQQCTYEEIALITEVPLGTVMSRLARARARLAESLENFVDPGDVS